MKKIKFIPFFCGLLFFGNYHANNSDLLTQNAAEGFYSEYFKDLNELKKDDKSYGFRFGSNIQEKEFEKYMGNRSFFNVSKFDNVKEINLDSDLIFRIKNNLEQDMLESYEKNAVDVRKMLYNVLQDFDIKFNVIVPRIFLTFPHEEKYEKISNDMLGNSSKYGKNSFDPIFEAIVDYFCINKFYNFLLNGDIDYDVYTNQKYLTNIKSSNIGTNGSIYEEENKKKMMFLIQLNTKNNIEIVDDEFIKFCVNYFEEISKNSGHDFITKEDNLCNQWINILESSKGKVLVGLSNIYIYFLVPSNYFNEARHLAVDTFVQKEFKKGFFKGYVTLGVSKIFNYISDKFI